MTVARPILMSAPMVLATLNGRKTQTRRALKHQPLDILPMRKEKRGREWVTLEKREPEPRGKVVRCRYGLPGDLLWVRESWQHAPQKYCSCPQTSEPTPCDDWSEGIGCRSNRGDVVYAADGGNACRWRPSIHMSRWASRLTLRITDVRVERLQDISEADAIAEGICFLGKNVNGFDMWAQFGAIADTSAGLCADVQFIGRTAKEAFRKLWESINGKASWAANPWVWPISYDPLQQNVDQVMRAAA